VAGLNVPPVPPVRFPTEPIRVRGLLKQFGVSAGGMSAQQSVMDTVSENIQNSRTTRTPQGTPYRRQVAVLERDPEGGGVRVARIVEDVSVGQVVHQPGHPDADAEGNVLYPNVDLMAEMADLMIARRVFEANATTFQTAKAMMRRALDI
jgi:flagellar basal-body rod protein FlgC